ncbi:MAG: hypothetical protein M1511_00215 [Deltaproteobacteria bacterium]|nr:hypothetical protein [Deltaproteobacteria bacterium]
MIKFFWIIFGVAFYVALLSSCSSVQTSALRPAGYENEKTGWIQRNLPSLEKLSNMIPPPTDARNKWDEMQNKQRGNNQPEERF